MKIESANYNNTHHTFAISFSDGITIILDENLNYLTMLSVGIESYYLKKGKWPSGKNLSTRVEKSVVWIEKNKNRYKKPNKKVAKSEK